MDKIFIKWVSVSGKLNIGAIPGNIVFFQNADVLGGLILHHSKAELLKKNIEFFGKKVSEKNSGKIEKIDNVDFRISENFKFGCQDEKFYITNDNDFLQKGGNKFLLELTRALVKVLPYVLNPSKLELSFFKIIRVTSLDSLNNKDINICDEFLNDNFDLILCWRNLVKFSK